MTASELVRTCLVAKAQGADFPTVWQTVLRGNPLVVGIPRQTITETHARLEIPLITGHHVIYDSTRNEYTLWPFDSA
jgi:hypothetical protein